MARKYKRIVFADRQRIEAMYKSGIKPECIAEKIGVHVATMYRELERGGVKDGTGYNADTAQRAIG